MTELSFLINLLLEHKLPDETKKVVAERIKEVELHLTAKPVSHSIGQFQPHIPMGPPASAIQMPPLVAPQSASTMALMAKHGDIPFVPPVPTQVMTAPEPVQNVAQTAATQAAILARNAAIQTAISGKNEKGRTSPRKW